VYVAWFDPAVLAEGVVDAVFVVAVAGGVGSHVCAEFEGVVSIRIHVLKKTLPSSPIFQGCLKVADDTVDHGCWFVSATK